MICYYKCPNDSSSVLLCECDAPSDAATQIIFTDTNEVINALNAGNMLLRFYTSLTYAHLVRFREQR